MTFEEWWQSINKNFVTRSDKAASAAWQYVEAQTREYYEGILAMTVARLEGTVEGQPTHRINFLQRIDELVRIEASLDSGQAIKFTLEEILAALRHAGEGRLEYAKPDLLGNYLNSLLRQKAHSEQAGEDGLLSAIRECDRHARFLKYEWEHGGDFEHLKTRYDEAQYLAGNLRKMALAASAPAPNPNPNTK